MTKVILLALLMGGAQGYASQDIESVPGEFVVVLKNEVKRKFTPSVATSILGSEVKAVLPEQGIYLVKRPSIELANASLQLLKSKSVFRIVEPNYIYRINRVPNDTSYTQLWGLANVGQMDSAGQVGTAGIDVGAEAAWDIQTDSSSVLTAVIDTGVDYNHPDLAENVFINQAEQNGAPNVDDDQNGYVDDVYGMNFSDEKGPKPNGLDDNGHGTHCAGTIGARGDDGKGIVGVNWRAKILPVKFLDSSGSGTLEAAILSIDYATKMGAKIMNNSWGGGGESQTLKEAIERSNQAGALFVAAAGNDGSDNDSTPRYPASYDVPNILVVAAIDNQGALANFSNYGRKSVHIAAPGVNVYSSITNGQYDSWSGTSMATPHVSGIAALVAANDSSLSALEIKNRIINTGAPISSLKNKVFKSSYANAYHALTNTQAPPDANDPAFWQSQAVKVSTNHPYGDNAKNSYEVEVKGAFEISLYFERFDTEKKYDKIEVFDRAGNILFELSGKNDDYYSPIIAGDYARIEFTSDDSVDGYGFDLTKAAFR